MPLEALLFTERPVVRVHRGQPELALRFSGWMSGLVIRR